MESETMEVPATSSIPTASKSDEANGSNEAAPIRISKLEVGETYFRLHLCLEGIEPLHFPMRITLDKVLSRDGDAQEGEEIQGGVATSSSLHMQSRRPGSHSVLLLVPPKDPIVVFPQLTPGTLYRWTPAMALVLPKEERIRSTSAGGSTKGDSDIPTAEDRSVPVAVGVVVPIQLSATLCPMIFHRVWFAAESSVFVQWIRAPLGSGRRSRFDKELHRRRKNTKTLERSTSNEDRLQSSGAGSEGAIITPGEDLSVQDQIHHWERLQDPEGWMNASRAEFEIEPVMASGGNKGSGVSSLQSSEAQRMTAADDFGDAQCVFRDLEKNALYKVRCRLRDASCRWGVWSSWTVTATTPTMNLVATEIGSNQLTVGWAPQPSTFLATADGRGGGAGPGSPAGAIPGGLMQVWGQRTPATFTCLLRVFDAEKENEFESFDADLLRHMDELHNVSGTGTGRSRSSAVEDPFERAGMVAKDIRGGNLCQFDSLMPNTNYLVRLFYTDVDGSPSCVHLVCKTSSRRGMSLLKRYASVVQFSNSLRRLSSVVESSTTASPMLKSPTSSISAASPKVTLRDRASLRSLLFVGSMRKASQLSLTDLQAKQASPVNASSPRGLLMSSSGSPRGFEESPVMEESSNFTPNRSTPTDEKAETAVVMPSNLELVVTAVGEDWVEFAVQRSQDADDYHFKQESTDRESGGRSYSPNSSSSTPTSNRSWEREELEALEAEQRRAESKRQTRGLGERSSDPFIDCRSMNIWLRILTRQPEAQCQSTSTLSEKQGPRGPMTTSPPPKDSSDPSQLMPKILRRPNVPQSPKPPIAARRVLRRKFSVGSQSSIDSEDDGGRQGDELESSALEMSLIGAEPPQPTIPEWFASERSELLLPNFRRLDEVDFAVPGEGALDVLIPAEPPTSAGATTAASQDDLGNRHQQQQPWRLRVSSLKLYQIVLAKLSTKHDSGASWTSFTPVVRTETISKPKLRVKTLLPDVIDFSVFEGWSPNCGVVATLPKTLGEVLNSRKRSLVKNRFNANAMNRSNDPTGFGGVKSTSKTSGSPIKANSNLSSDVVEYLRESDGEDDEDEEEQEKIEKMSTYVQVQSLKTDNADLAELTTVPAWEYPEPLKLDQAESATQIPSTSSGGRRGSGEAAAATAGLGSKLRTGTTPPSTPSASPTSPQSAALTSHYWFAVDKIQLNTRIHFTAQLVVDGIPRGWSHPVRHICRACPISASILGPTSFSVRWEATVVRFAIKSSTSERFLLICEEIATGEKFTRDLPHLELDSETFTFEGMTPGRYRVSLVMTALVLSAVEWEEAALKYWQPRSVTVSLVQQFFPVPLYVGENIIAFIATSDIEEDLIFHAGRRFALNGFSQTEQDAILNFLLRLAGSTTSASSASTANTGGAGSKANRVGSRVQISDGRKSTLFQSVSGSFDANDDAGSGSRGLSHRSSRHSLARSGFLQAAANARKGSSVKPGQQTRLVGGKASNSAHLWGVSDIAEFEVEIGGSEFGDSFNAFPAGSNPLSADSPTASSPNWKLNSPQSPLRPPAAAVSAHSTPTQVTEIPSSTARTVVRTVKTNTYLAFVIDGLQPGTSYRVRVRPKMAAGVLTSAVPGAGTSDTDGSGRYQNLNASGGYGGSGAVSPTSQTGGPQTPMTGKKELHVATTHWSPTIDITTSPSLRIASNGVENDELTVRWADPGALPQWMEIQQSLTVHLQQSRAATTQQLQRRLSGDQRRSPDRGGSPLTFIDQVQRELRAEERRLRFEETHKAPKDPFALSTEGDLNGSQGKDDSGGPTANNAATKTVAPTYVKYFTSRELDTSYVWDGEGFQVATRGGPASTSASGRSATTGGGGSAPSLPPHDAAVLHLQNLVQRILQLAGTQQQNSNAKMSLGTQVALLLATTPSWPAGLYAKLVRLSLLPSILFIAREKPLPAHSRILQGLTGDHASENFHDRKMVPASIGRGHGVVSLDPAAIASIGSASASLETRPFCPPVDVESLIGATVDEISQYRSVCVAIFRPCPLRPRVYAQSNPLPCLTGLKVLQLKLDRFGQRYLVLRCCRNTMLESLIERIRSGESRMGSTSPVSTERRLSTDTASDLGQSVTFVGGVESTPKSTSSGVGGGGGGSANEASPNASEGKGPNLGPARHHSHHSTPTYLSNPLYDIPHFPEFAKLHRELRTLLARAVFEVQDSELRMTEMSDRRSNRSSLQTGLQLNPSPAPSPMAGDAFANPAMAAGGSGGAAGGGGRGHGGDEDDPFYDSPLLLAGKTTTKQNVIVGLETPFKLSNLKIGSLLKLSARVRFSAFGWTPWAAPIPATTLGKILVGLGKVRETTIEVLWARKNVRHLPESLAAAYHAELQTVEVVVDGMLLKQRAPNEVEDPAEMQLPLEMRYSLRTVTHYCNGQAKKLLLQDLLPGKIYSIKARASDANGQWSEYSPAIEVRCQFPLRCDPIAVGETFAVVQLRRTDGRNGSDLAGTLRSPSSRRSRSISIVPEQMLDVETELRVVLPGERADFVHQHPANHSSEQAPADGPTAAKDDLAPAQSTTMEAVEALAEKGDSHVKKVPTVDPDTMLYVIQHLNVQQQAKAKHGSRTIQVYCRAKTAVADKNYVPWEDSASQAGSAGTSGSGANTRASSSDEEDEAQEGAENETGDSQDDPRRNSKKGKEPALKPKAKKASQHSDPTWGNWCGPFTVHLLPSLAPSLESIADTKALLMIRRNETEKSSDGATSQDGSFSPLPATSASAAEVSPPIVQLRVNQVFSKQPIGVSSAFKTSVRLNGLEVDSLYTVYSRTCVEVLVPIVGTPGAANGFDGKGDSAAGIVECPGGFSVIGDWQNLVRLRTTPRRPTMPILYEWRPCRNRRTNAQETVLSFSWGLEEGPPGQEGARALAMVQPFVEPSPSTSVTQKPKAPKAEQMGKLLVTSENPLPKVKQQELAEDLDQDAGSALPLVGQGIDLVSDAIGGAPESLQQQLSWRPESTDSSVKGARWVPRTFIDMLDRTKHQIHSVLDPVAQEYTSIQRRLSESKTTSRALALSPGKGAEKGDEENRTHLNIAEAESPAMYTLQLGELAPVVVEGRGEDFDGRPEQLTNDEKLSTKVTYEFLVEVASPMDGTPSSSDVDRGGPVSRGRVDGHSPTGWKWIDVLRTREAFCRLKLEQGVDPETLYFRIRTSSIQANQYFREHHQQQQQEPSASSSGKSSVELWSDPSSCVRWRAPKPPSKCSRLRLINVTHEGFTAVWAPPMEVLQWNQVRFKVWLRTAEGPTSTTTEGGTPASTAAEEWICAAVCRTPTVTLTGLCIACKYEVAVSAICTWGESAPSTPIPVVTRCHVSTEDMSSPLPCPSSRGGTLSPAVRFVTRLSPEDVQKQLAELDSVDYEKHLLYDNCIEARHWEAALESSDHATVPFPCDPTVDYTPPFCFSAGNALYNPSMGKRHFLFSNYWSKIERARQEQGQRSRPLPANQEDETSSDGANFQFEPVLTKVEWDDLRKVRRNPKTQTERDPNDPQLLRLPAPPKEQSVAADEQRQRRSTAERAGNDSALVLYEPPQTNASAGRKKESLVELHPDVKALIPDPAKQARLRNQIVAMKGKTQDQVEGGGGAHWGGGGGGSSRRVKDLSAIPIEWDLQTPAQRSSATGRGRSAVPQASSAATPETSASAAPFGSRRQRNLPSHRLQQ